jgi:acyl-coenzyme A synthetase/AMP-(fatty) acid ligase
MRYPILSAPLFNFYHARGVQNLRNVIRPGLLKVKYRTMSRGIVDSPPLIEVGKNTFHADEFGIQKTKRYNCMNLSWYKGLLSLPADREFIVNGCTYGDIYSLAGRIYSVSQSSGASEISSICLCTDDRTLLMAALMASLAGGPRLIFPHALSKQALAEVHTALSPSFYLTGNGDSDMVPSGKEVITPSLLAQNTGLAGNPRDIDEPFIILFTGGSTGTPKIWEKTPRNMFEEARYQAEDLGIAGDDLFLSTVPPYHIYGLLFSLLVPFVATARVLNRTYVFPREIIKAAFDFGASVLVSNPAHYRVLKLQELQRNRLRVALSSAGALDKGDAIFFYQKTGLAVTEIFGSTETGGIAKRQSPEEDSWKPLSPVEWKLEADGKLCVRSDFLSPALPRDVGGFFVTSDCVELEGARHFILRGRADSVVKVGGKRVDMAAVQNTLKKIQGVRDAVVIALPVEKGRQNELAAVVETNLSASQLRRELVQIVEAYAVPKRIAVVEAIPVTPAGKYERAAIEKLLEKVTSDKSRVTGSGII